MMKAKPEARPLRHIPRRTCIGCRETSAKRELVRLVCLPDGRVEIDTTGKKSGRGAYLCNNRACWENALNSGRLEYALRVRLNQDNKAELVKYAVGLNNTSSG